MVSIRGWLLETLKQDDTLINAEAKAKTLFLWRRFLMRQKNWQQTWIENHPLGWKIICAIGDMLIFFMKFMISMLIFLWLVN